ncbi:MAG: FAD-dependent oxidoreductase [Clostridia bacterium]|nr:FAD-dependent oxidoreductase [Clostridia bacterium]
MFYDLIIVGGGPAGLTAALYARRASKSALVIEKETFGGQITFSPKVENIPGFAELSGNEFAEKLVDQVLRQGADMESATVLSVRPNPDGTKTVVTDEGDFEAKAVIIASGAKHRLLGLPGEEDWIGNGISFCAVCDGAFYEGREVAVVGGGNSALQEAILLSDLASRVTVVQNLDFLTGEQQLQDQLRAKSNVDILTGCVLDAYLGTDELTGIRIRNTHDQSLSELKVDGVFLAVGLLPQNEPFAGVLALDERGYADADESCKTPTEGVFVAGDCRSKRIRQVTTAAADGAVAALAACDYIDANGKK